MPHSLTKDLKGTSAYKATIIMDANKQKKPIGKLTCFSSIKLCPWQSFQLL